MDKASAVKQADVVNVETKTPPLRLPDAASTAEVVLNQAMQYCAQKMGLKESDGSQIVIDLLKQGDSVACGYCHYSVARHVAQSLGALDESVQAVYVCDYDATPEDLCFAREAQASPIHMIVWAKRKTGALNSLAKALDRALAQNFAKLVGTSQAAHILDVQVIDDVDVQKRVGYAAFLSSLHHRPIKVWER
jgi:hypothetical protein